MNVTTCLNRQTTPEQKQACLQVFKDTCVNREIEIDIQKIYYDIWSETPLCSLMTHQLSRGNPQEILTIQESIQTIFNRIYEGNPLYISGTQPLIQDYLYMLCKENPVACKTSLLNICSRYTRGNLVNTPGIGNFCGCYLLPSEYSREESLFGISRECSSLCYPRTTIPYAGMNNKVKECTESICIINDITMRLIESSSRNISFSQACGSCKEGGVCRCSISNVSITAIKAKLPNIKLEQNCQGNIICYGPDPDNPTAPEIEIPCDINQEDVAQKHIKEEKTSLVWIIISFAILYILIILLAVFRNKYR